MDRKTIITALVAGFFGFIAGNAFWYLASPLWIDRVVQEDLPNAATTAVVRNGSFKDADAAHKGSGTAQLLRAQDGRHILRFTDFKSTNGPDLKVYLVEAADINSASDVTSSKWVSLGPLKGNIGDQNYTLSEELDPARFGSVVIWCEQFGVLFSSATLKPAS